MRIQHRHSFHNNMTLHPSILSLEQIRVFETGSVGLVETQLFCIASASAQLSRRCQQKSLVLMSVKAWTQNIYHSYIVKAWTQYTFISVLLGPSRKHANIKSHIYIVKLGFTGVYTIFFLFLLKYIDCGYSLEPPRRSVSNKYPQYMI